MSCGRLAKPSATAEAAAPVAAAIGTLVPMSPAHSKPPATPASTSKTQRTDALIQHTAQQTCTVQHRDTLTSIARRFHGNPMKRHQIYHANTSDISNPDLLYPGQKPTIPGAATRQIVPGQQPMTTVTVTQTATRPRAQQASSEPVDGGSDGS